MSYGQLVMGEVKSTTAPLLTFPITHYPSLFTDLSNEQKERK
jgi:hypothetical protein